MKRQINTFCSFWPCSDYMVFYPQKCFYFCHKTISSNNCGIKVMIVPFLHVTPSWEIKASWFFSATFMLEVQSTKLNSLLLTTTYKETEKTMTLIPQLGVKYISAAYLSFTFYSPTPILYFLFANMKVKINPQYIVCYKCGKSS